MDSPKITYKYYSNPAFCAQSEVTYTQQTPCVSPRITTSPKSKFISLGVQRVPPLGANLPKKLLPQFEISNQRVRTDISDNHLRNIKGEGPLRYVNSGPNSIELPPKPGPKPSRYAVISPEGHELRKTVVRNIKRSNQGIIRDPFIRRGSKNDNVHVKREKDEEVEMFQVVNVTGIGHEDIAAEEETEMAMHNLSPRVLKHRYAEIPDDFEYSPTKKRIVETEAKEYNVDCPNEDEYKEVPAEIVRSVNGKVHRYARIPTSDDDDDDITVYQAQPENLSPPTFYLKSPGMTRKNLEATQKLHVLLASPIKHVRKTVIESPMKSCASSPSIRNQLNNTPNRAMSPDRRGGFPITPSKKIISSTPKQVMTPSKSCVNLTSPPLPRRNSNLTSPVSPRAQKKLHYGYPNTDGMNLSPGIRDGHIPDFYVKESSHDRSRDHDRSFDLDRSRNFDRSRDFERSRDYDRELDDRKQIVFTNRSTAIISPRLVSHNGDVIYREEKILPEKGWRATPGCATLALAAIMMALCGTLSAALSFYIMYIFGRKYYLDFGVLSGFTCLILGLLGFRTRTNRLLPNRNYISGYILLSLFSLLSCAALLTLIIGSGGRVGQQGPLGDVVGGAVSCLGALCLLLAGTGTIASCCCRKPPPDNRVADV